MHVVHDQRRTANYFIIGRNRSCELAKTKYAEMFDSIDAEDNTDDLVAKSRMVADV